VGGTRCPSAWRLSRHGVADLDWPAMVFYAILENDMRRILAYSIVNQVGFLVRGIALRNHPPMRAM
jgi:NADH:ubiquinone oxidoreductase subunit 4 (subunit M)